MTILASAESATDQVYTWFVALIVRVCVAIPRKSGGTRVAEAAALASTLVRIHICKKKKKGGRPLKLKG